jgi:hypothetical protein
LAWPCCCASVERHLLHCMSPFMARVHRRNLDLTASLLRKLATRRVPEQAIQINAQIGEQRKSMDRPVPHDRRRIWRVEAFLGQETSG